MPGRSTKALCEAIRNKGISVHHIRLINEIYKGAETQVKNNIGILDSFKVKAARQFIKCLSLCHIIG